MTMLSQLQKFLSNLPDFQMQEEREALIGQVGFEHLRSKIDWSGNANTFVHGLINVLIQEGRETLLTFLIQLETDDTLLGLDQKRKLADLRQAITDLALEQWETKVTEHILDSATIQKHLGPAARWVKLSEVIPLSDEEIQQFYKGAPLTWNLIAAQGDVERDIKDELMKNLSAPTQRTTMWCISGEPGSGKSTFARRIAADLAQAKEKPLLHILNNRVYEAWYGLEYISQQYEVPLALVVLVDDVFRNKDAAEALSSISPDLHITIIAASRSNEIPDDLRLPFPLQIKELSAPTPQEKMYMLQKLRLRESDLKVKQLQRLRIANSWLAMMIEMTTGEELKKIVRDSVHRLQEQDPIVYRAYEYLCYAGQYDLAIPKTLIAKLDSQGNFYNLLEYPASKGLIFESSSVKDAIRTQHATIAREALNVYRRGRDPLIPALHFINGIQPNLSEHRFFLYRLLYQLALDPQKLQVARLLQQKTNILEEVLANSRSGELMYWWIGLYQILHNQEKVTQLKEMVLTRAPQTYTDWHAHFRLIEQTRSWEQMRALIDTCTPWLSANPQDTVVRTAYLAQVKRKGTAKQIATAISTTADWLTGHPQNTNIRYAYLLFLKDKGTSEQTTASIDATTDWLSANPQDFTVRTAYLALVKDKGTNEQTTTIINATAAWLIANPQDSTVRAAYLTLVKVKGTIEQTTTIINVTASWLAVHPQDSTVRAAYLTLVKDRGTVKQADMLIEATTGWLAANPQDIAVRIAYLALIEHAGTIEQIVAAIETTTAWLVANPQDDSVREAYLGLVEQAGTVEQIATMIDATTSWLAANPQDGSVRAAYLGLVNRRGTSEQVQSAITITIEWLASRPNDVNIRNTYLGLVKRRGTVEQVVTMLPIIADWLATNPQDTNIRQTYISLVDHYGTAEQRITLIDTTAEWLAFHSQDNNVRHTYLRLVEHHGLPEQLLLAYDLTKHWIDQHPTTKDSYMIEGYGLILLKLERYKEAEKQFRWLLKIKKSYVPGHVWLAWSLYYQGKKKESYEELQQVKLWAEKGKYSLGGALKHLGRYHFLIGDLEQAIQHFQGAIREEPQHYSNYMELGRTLLAQREFDQAFVALETAQKYLQISVNEKIRRELQELTELSQLEND